jgi:dipeptidyl aminopeptidase/acylaminoacyl peptidase
VSRNGVIGDVWDYFGGDTWSIAIRTLNNETLANYTVDSASLLSFPTSAAALNSSASLLAYSVNEMNSTTDSTRLERTYINNLQTGALVAHLENRAEPVFVDNGELLLRNDDRLHVYNASLQDQGALPITVNKRFGAFTASPDGRYIVYESGSRLRVYDRTTGNHWQATDDFGRSHYAPVFSPDGQWLAFLRAGAVANAYLAIIPFVPNATRTISDTDEVKSPNGNVFAGSGRIGWAR